MLKTDYNIPIFEDTDAADLNKYSNEMANALKTQINNTNNEIKEIDKKVVDAVDKFTEPLSYKGQLSTIQDLPISATNGDIYNVTSENKNYIYNGTNWVEYSSTLDLTYLENNTKTTQTTEVSEELTIENCAGVKGKLDIKSGKSIEEGEPSPDNIIPIRNVGDNINLFDKSTITSGYRLSTTGEPNVSAGTNYTSDFIPIDGNTTYIRTNTVDAYTRWCFYDSSKTFISKDDANQIITTPSNARYIRFSEYLSRIDTMKLEKGSKLTNYSEYNCGSADLKVSNKNRLNMIKYEETLRGVTATTEGSEILLNGTVTQGGYVLRKSNIDKLQAGTYIFKFYINQNEITIPSGGAIAFNLQNSDTDKTILEKTFAGDKQGTFTLETETNIGINIYANKVSTIFNNAIIKVQIEKGNVATDYVEHKKQTISFPLTEGQLLHKGDYLAEDGIHQVRKTLVLTGTENWSTRTSTVGRLFELVLTYKGLPDTNLNNKTISSHFIGNLGLNNNYEIRVINATLTIHYDDVSTVDEWKTYLAEQYANSTPLEIEYDLAEEIVTPLTKEQEQAYYELQHLLMYEGYTSIECIDEIKPDIQLTYWYNNELNKSYGERFDKVEENINELEKREIYSTEEQVIGSWIDNKPLYRKTIDVGNLPNATTKNISFNILNLKNIIKIEGYAKGPNYWLPIPYSNITVMCNSSVVGITTTIDRSNCTGFITLYYTKTTD